MLKKFRDWLDDRTGYRNVVRPLQRRVLPTGPKWGHATANTLLWMMLTVVITGVLMMASYSPSTTSAWSSVHYIDQNSAGAFLRGLHFYGSHAMIILFAIHTLRVLVVAAFRAPHEIVWITGLLLMPMVVVWAITGNPLSATQRGFSQIEVEGNIIASTPVIGPIIQRLLIGGDEVGNLTLTHLYSLHIFVFPLLVGLLLAIHLHQVYRHGLGSSPDDGSGGPARPYWPYQTVRNMTVFGITFSIVAVLAWRQGAPLDAPADPDLPHWTRPEWYFLFLFELRRYFGGSWEFIATAVIPGVALLLLIGMPAIDRMASKRMSAVFRGAIILAGVVAWGTLTGASVWRDWGDKEHQSLTAELEGHAERARELADRDGISPAGAISLLRNDSQTQGPRLFRQHCVSCHSHVDTNGEGIVAEEPSAPNLYRFASREWLAGMLDPEACASESYYGNTEFAEGDMVGSVQDTLADLDDDGKASLAQLIAALSAEAMLSSQAALDEQARADGTIELGVAAMVEEFACIECHKIGDEGELGAAPDLTGYGSADWLRALISNPEHERFYPDTNDRMPAFSASDGDSSRNLLTEHDLDLLIRWLRGDGEHQPVGATSGPDENASTEAGQGGRGPMRQLPTYRLIRTRHPRPRLMTPPNPSPTISCLHRSHLRGKLCGIGTV
ncbi:MAG: hypothetical protein CMJ64_11265 [Planctomycetaceae bacterium]|nr:hypothetical protein [Planctomycetaceae bacterium]